MPAGAFAHLKRKRPVGFLPLVRAALAEQKTAILSCYTSCLDKRVLECGVSKSPIRRTAADYARALEDLSDRHFPNPKKIVLARLQERG